jgi:hypothetical protein
MLRMRKRLLHSVALALFLLFVVVFPVLAAAYSATFTITEANGTAYSYLPVVVSSPNTWMAANGFMKSTALDTRVQTIGGLVYPHMVADDKILAVPTAIPASGQVNLSFTTGNSDLTSMYIVTGNGGTITRADVATMEPGNNFEFDFGTAYYNSSVTGDYKNFLYKEGAYWFGAIGGSLIAGIGGTETITQNATMGSFTVAGVNWLTQTFTTPNYPFEIITIRAYGTGFGAGGDTVTAALKAVDPATGKPTGADLASDSQAEGAANPYTFTLAYDTSPSTQYAIVLSATGDGVTINRQNTNPYAGGQVGNSADSGVTWVMDATQDIQFTVTATGYGTALVSAASTGSHTVKTTADTVNHKLWVDGVAVSTTALGGASVPDNGNDWLIMDNSTTQFLSYITYYKHTVGGALIAWYQPITIVNTTVLPDRQGAAENGAITWGSNPAGVAVTLGGMVSAGQPSVGGTTTTTPADLLPGTNPSDWFVEPDVTGALLTNPLRPIVTMVSDNTTLTELQTWRWFGIIVVVLLVGIAIRLVPRHLVVACVAGGVATVALVVMTIWPLWTLTFLALFALGGWISERSPSV